MVFLPLEPWIEEKLQYFSSPKALSSVIVAIGKRGQNRGQALKVQVIKWMLRGIPSDKHIITDQGLIDHYIKLWSALLSQRIHT